MDKAMDYNKNGNTDNNTNENNNGRNWSAIPNKTDRQTQNNNIARFALISGSSRGIGAAIARELASQGYNLYLTCHHSKALLEELAANLSHEYNITCTCFTGDIGNYNFVQECFREIASLDILVNNAGVSYVGLSLIHI